jgi:isocitrate lyase
MMKSTMLVIARTDADSGNLISSTVDVADHPFIKGTITPDTLGLADAIAAAEASGASGFEIDQVEKDWTASHVLCTFNEGQFIRFMGVRRLLKSFI